MNSIPHRWAATIVASISLLGGCGKSDLGQGGSVVQGGAGPGGANKPVTDLVQCSTPVTSVSLNESPNGYSVLSSYQLPPSPLPLIRLIMQQSGCFRVLDRSLGLRATVQEQELKAQGILKESTVVKKGEGIGAKMNLTPSLVFSENNAGQGWVGILQMIPVLRDFAGIAGNVKVKEAQVVLLLVDNETTEQIAAATGSARATDLGLGGITLGKISAGGLGWSNTNEGKVIAAAFLDAHNKLVAQLRALPAARLKE